MRFLENPKFPGKSTIEFSAKKYKIYKKQNRIAFK